MDLLAHMDKFQYRKRYVPAATLTKDVPTVYCGCFNTASGMYLLQHYTAEELQNSESESFNTASGMYLLQLDMIILLTLIFRMGFNTASGMYLLQRLLSLLPTDSYEVSIPQAVCTCCN